MQVYCVKTVYKNLNSCSISFLTATNVCMVFKKYETAAKTTVIAVFAVCYVKQSKNGSNHILSEF